MGAIAGAVQLDTLVARDVVNTMLAVQRHRAPGFALEGLLIGPGTHQTTMEEWYTSNVIGGPSGFLIKANGFDDFGRAFRQKFVSEISRVDEGANRR